MNSKDNIFLILIVGIIIFFLFEADVLIWKGEFGLSELLNVVLGGFTVYAVRLSSKATESAKQAALYSKSQTLIMEKEFHNTHSPKLLPIPTECSLSLLDMKMNFQLIDIYSQIPDIGIQITNVFQGNAYMVSSWLEVEKEDLIDYYSKKFSPDIYNKKTDNYYRLESWFSEYSTDCELHINTTNFNPTIGDFDHDNETLSLRTEIRNQASILKYNENVLAHIPTYMYPILLDILYNAWEDDTFFEKEEAKIIKLKVKYQSGDQIDSNNYLFVSYHLIFSNLITPHLKEDDHGLNNNEFKFTLNFRKIEHN